MLPPSAIIITTINQPTSAIRSYAENRHKLNARVVVIGDSKSPSDFTCEGVDYYSLDQQRQLTFALAQKNPIGHYSRKNIGYLEAMREGAKIIIETDDDNFPYSTFWEPRAEQHQAVMVRRAGWANIYRHFSQQPIWPRGLPLDAVQEPLEVSDLSNDRLFAAPIQQGLADGDPDVDAVYRLVYPLPIKFDTAPAIILSSGTWCPFNSQNTTWFPAAFPLLYLPSYCSFRMTDIWRSFVAQRIGWENGWNILFHNATVFQERNEHNLMRDFEDEIPGYLNNRAIADQLYGLSLKPGMSEIPSNMRECYNALIESGWIGKGERVLLEAWLHDLSANID